MMLVALIKALGATGFGEIGMLGFALGLIMWVIIIGIYMLAIFAPVALIIACMLYLTWTLGVYIVRCEMKKGAPKDAPLN